MALRMVMLKPMVEVEDPRKIHDARISKVMQELAYCTCLIRLLTPKHGGAGRHIPYLVELKCLTKYLSKKEEQTQQSLLLRRLSRVPSNKSYRVYPYPLA